MGNKNNIIDVLIIGAGMSGGAFAWSLSETGISVVCLEQGGWIDPTTYPSTHDDWELHVNSDFNLDPNLRGLPEDYPINNDNTPIEPLMYNAVGGSAIHWGAHFPRMRPSDFKVKTLDDVADDWPFTYYELEPFFDLNDRMTGVAGLNGNPAYPNMPPRKMLPVPLGKPARKLVDGFERLNWHWWPAESAINTAQYDGRPACTNGGSCVTGCHNRSKSSSDVTYWPKAVDNGAVLKTGARVSEIIIGKNGLVEGAVYFDQKGRAHEQKARITVIACNGVGTPRLLLNSKSGLFPDGLANNSGLVGKNLMFHPVAMTVGAFDEDLESHQGPLAVSITSYEHYETDQSRGFVRGYQLQGNRELGPLNTALGGPLEQSVPWGSEHHQALDERLGRIIPLAALIEDLPECHNEVVLDSHLTDGHGIPSPKINYTISDNSRKMLAHAIESAKEVMEAAGANKIFVNPTMKKSGWHLLGTARMGTNKKESVTDQWGRTHDVRNLFIIDGSLFVTGGAVNPTSTIQALALRIADYIKNNARHLVS